MNSFTKSVLFRYTLAVVAVVVATLIRWPLQPWIDDRYPFLFYFGTVALVAWRCGVGPSVLAIAFSLIAVAIFVLPPEGSVELADPNTWAGLLLFLIVTSVIAKVAWSLQTLRLRTETAKAEQLKLLTYVREVGHALTRSSSLQGMLEECVQATALHLDNPFVGVWLLDADGQALNLHASAGLSVPADGVHAKVTVGQFEIGLIAQGRRPHLTDSVQTDSLVSGQDWSARTGIKAFAGYPLIVDDRLVGVMAMYSRQQLQPATLDLLASVTTEIALGIERKRSEENLRRQREWLRVTLESIGDAMIATDEIGRITMLNAVAETLTGWKSMDALGRSLEEVFRIVDETTRLPSGNPALRAMEGGRIVGLSNHTVLIARDGAERVIDDSAAPIRDGDGRIAGVVLIFRDVSRRREAEQKLQESEARKSAVLETSLDGIITIDTEGRVVEFNPAAERIFGFTRNRVIGQRISELIIPPSLRPLHDAGMAEFGSTGEGPILGRRIEVTGLRADGTEIPVELAVTQLSVAGKVFFTAHVRDISERRAFDKRRAARIRVTEILAETPSISKAMPRILQTVCNGLGWNLATFWIVDPEAKALTCQAIWSEDGSDADRLAKTHRSMRITPDSESLSATAWRSGKPAWISHNDDVPASLRSDEGARDGLRGSLAYPISAGETVLGVVEFYCDHGGGPDADLLEMLGTLGGQIGQFLQRQRAEAALRAGDERLRLALDAGRMGTWEWNIATGSVFWSTALEEIHGLESGTFPGTFEAYQSDMHPDDRPAVLASIDRALNGGGLHHIEYRLILPDGSLRWVEARGKLFRDDSGAPVNMIGVCMDITERKRIDAERSRLISIIEHSPNFIGLADDDQRAIFVNRAGQELVGLDKSDSPKNLIDYFHENEGERVRRDILPILIKEGHWDGEVLFRNFKTGRPIPMLWNAFTIRERESSRPYFACVSTDVTERKQAEAEIRRQGDQFHCLADSIPQLAWMARPDGWIYWYNKRWHDYTGKSFEEMEGRGWRAVHDPSLVDEVERKFKASIAAGVPWEDTFPLRRHDGAMRWHLSRAMPIKDEHGQIVQWFGTNTDITERMELEESLKEADRRKDLFLATLAHELRNPLAPIRNALHIMKGQAGQPDVLEAERAMAERQVVHLTRLVEDLMDVSRINTGKIDLRKQVVELSIVVRNAVDSVSSAVHERNHQLSVKLPSEPILLEADPTRLEQILLNLLNNATKYTDPGGSIELSVVRQDDRRVCIHVRDSGLGIAPEVLPTVFGMFVQVGHHRGHSRGGLGIGLNLVKNLVEMHGGSIIAKSGGEGEGSEFVVELPVLDASKNSPIGVQGDPLRADGLMIRRHRILIVDDNEDAANSLSRLLSKLYGQVVQVVHNGPDALQRAVQFQPHIVLLDIGLPGMDGFEVARRLRADPRFRRIRIVALTGWGQEDDRQKSHEAGFDAHFVKPLDPHLLESLLTTWTEREPA